MSGVGYYIKYKEGYIVIKTYPMKRLEDDYILGLITYEQYESGMLYLIKLKNEQDEV